MKFTENYENSHISAKSENGARLKVRTHTQTNTGQNPEAAPPSHAGNSHPVDGLRPPTPIFMFTDLLITT